MLDRTDLLSKKITSIFLIILLTLGLCLSPLSTLLAYADTRIGEFEAPNEEVKTEAENNMFVLSTADLNGFDHIANWVLSRESYIFCQKLNDDGGQNIYFNTPNLQRSIRNMMQALNSGGMKFNTYDDSILDPDKSQKWTTAEKKYGYALPNNTYDGEMPAIVLDMSVVGEGVANVGNGVKLVYAGVVNGIGNAVCSFGQTLANLMPWTTPEEYKEKEFVRASLDFGDVFSNVRGMTYNTSDYEENSQQTDKIISNWLGENWGFIVEHAGDYRELTYGDDNKVLIDEFIGLTFEEDISTQEKGKIILNDIVKKCGSTYTLALDYIINKSVDLGLNQPVVPVIRNMPYNIEDMSSASVSYMNNIADPRVIMFGTEDSSDIGIIDSIFKEFTCQVIGNGLLTIVAGLCYISSLMNSWCSFSMFDDIGIDMSFAWGGTIGTFIFQCFAIMMLIMCLIGVIRVVRGNKSAMEIATKVIMTIVALAICMNVALAPEKACGILKDTVSKIMNLSTSTIDSQETFQKLHVDNASESDKSSLRFWYMYYNTWVSYTTGVTSSEEAAHNYNPNDKELGRNEYTEYSLGGSSKKACLAGDKKMTLWPIVLIEEEIHMSNNAYRAIDHYMAPIVVKDSFPDFEVQENPFYKKNMQSELPIGETIMSFALVIVTFLKFLCFIELAIDVMLLVIRMLLSSISGKQAFAEPLTQIGWSIVRIVTFDTMISLLIYFSFKVSGTGLIMIGVLSLVLAIVFVAYSIARPNNIFVPGLFKVMSNAGERIKHVVTGSTVANSSAVYQGSKNNVVAQKVKDMEARREEKEAVRNKLNKLRSGE